MNGLPEIRIRAAPGWQKERLTRWLREWLIDRALSRPGALTPPAAESPLPGAPAAATVRDVPGSLPGAASEAAREMTPAPGQIRILRPVTPRTRGRLIYVAVLSSMERDGFLVAPYSRFSEPALPGELLTGRETACLRVLAVWNARRVPAGQMESSWFVDELSGGELDDALALWQGILDGNGPPSGLQTRTGPALQHPADPRNDYCAEEMSSMGDFGSARPAALAAVMVMAGDAEPERTLLKAAESRAPYGRAMRFRAPERNAVLEIVSDAGTGQCSVAVTDAQGKRGRALDGCRLQSQSGKMSQPIENGQLGIPAELIRNRFVLITPAGKPLPLEPAE